MFGSLGGSGCFLRISFLPKNLSAIAGLRGGRHVLCQRAKSKKTPVCETLPDTLETQNRSLVCPYSQSISVALTDSNIAIVEKTGSKKWVLVRTNTPWDCRFWFFV